MRVVAGKVDVRSKGIDAWLNQQNANFFNAGAEETEYNTNSTNPAITVNTSNNSINIDGNTYPLDNNYGNTITDGAGNVTVVTPSGQVITVGSTTGTPIPTNKKYINSAIGTALFSATAQQLYGYDQYSLSQWSNWYEKTTDIATHSQLPVDWKSVQSKKYDMVELTIQLANTQKSQLKQKNTLRMLINQRLSV
jgi:hypothetical protein